MQFSLEKFQRKSHELLNECNAKIFEKDEQLRKLTTQMYN